MITSRNGLPPHQPVLVTAAALLGAVLGGGCNEMLLPPEPAPSSATTQNDPSGRAAVTRAEHLTFFPIAAGSKHADISCDSCHQDATTFKQFTCLSCHAHADDVAATRHLYITEFRYQSNACFNCHPTGWEAAITIKDHSAKYFSINAGSHSTLLCNSCHTDPTTAKPFSCLTCHDHDSTTMAARHSAVADFQYQSERCLGCHPDNASTAR